MIVRKGPIARLLELATSLRAYERWLTMRRSVPTFFAQGPWRLTGRDWLASVVRTVRGARDDDYGTAASAIAFASFLALLPLLGAVALTYGMVTPADRVVADIRALLFILPGEARGFMGDWLVRSITRSEGREAGLLISIAVALFSALRAGRTIIAALNTASGVDTRRGFLRRRIVALLIVFGRSADPWSSLRNCQPRLDRTRSAGGNGRHPTVAARDILDGGDGWRGRRACAHLSLRSQPCAAGMALDISGRACRHSRLAAGYARVRLVSGQLRPDRKNLRCSGCDRGFAAVAILVWLHHAVGCEAER